MRRMKVTDVQRTLPIDTENNFVALNIPESADTARGKGYIVGQKQYCLLSICILNNRLMFCIKMYKDKDKDV